MRHYIKHKAVTQNKSTYQTEFTETYIERGGERMLTTEAYPVLASSGIDALDPKRAHVALLVAAVSVGVLQRFLYPLPRYSYAVFCPPSEPLC